MKIISALFIFAIVFTAACKVSETKFEPKAVINQYIAALEEKNIEKLKENASAKTIVVLNDAAKRSNLSLEEMIKKNEPQIPEILKNPEVRNEKVEGDRATVEIKNPTNGKWDNITFVKEDNRWKIAAGEMLEEGKR